MFQEQNESEGIQVGKLWSEMRDWRKHWKLSRFFEVLIFGLAASLFDTGTDFNFVWNVPEACHTAVGNITECGVQDFDLAQISSPCGMYHYKEVERLTYTYIAFPGFFLGYSGLQNLVAALVNKCWGGQVHRIVHGLAGALAAALECSIFLGLALAAIGHNDWTCTFPLRAEVYDYIIQGMAYLSAAFTIGVKFLGTICHGPTSSRLLFRAKGAETIFEATLQLGLLSRIFLSSGIGTTASLLSAIGVYDMSNPHQYNILSISIFCKTSLSISIFSRKFI